MLPYAVMLNLFQHPLKKTTLQFSFNLILQPPRHVEFISTSPQKTTRQFSSNPVLQPPRHVEFISTSPEKNNPAIFI